MNELLLRRRVSESTPVEVEYFELVSGNNRFMTDYRCQGDGIRILSKFKYDGYSASDNYQEWYCSRTTDSTPTYRLVRKSGNTIYIQNNRVGSTTSENNFTLTVGTIYTFDVNDSRYIINGTSYTHKMRAATGTNTGKLRILHGNLKGRFYYLQIYNNDVLELDLVPYRIGSKPYVYDRVGNKFYENQGGGVVTFGPDV